MHVYKGFDQYEIIERFAPGLESFLEEELQRKLDALPNDITREYERECVYLDYEKQFQLELSRVFEEMGDVEFESARKELIQFVFRVGDEQGRSGYPRFYQVLPHIHEKHEFLHYFFLLYPKLWS